MKVLAETSLKELLRLIKTSFFRKAEAQEVGTIDIDDAPTDGSDNLVKSGGVFNALAVKQAAISDLATIRNNAAAGAAKVSCTDATVGGFGYTKNTGTYSKPSGGIPKTDLASAVQTSLGRADTAVQPETGKGLFSGNYNDLTNKPTIPAAVTDEHINSLIDAKLNALDGNGVSY